MAKDYYQLLGVSKSASADQIKGAFRELAMKYHPDRNKDKNAEATFKEINEAYAVLSDPDKRKQYDMYGPAGFGQRFSQEDIFRGANFEDIMRDIQENMFGFQGFGGGPFQDIFGGQEQQQQGVNLYLSFDEIEKGVNKEFEVQRYKTCDNCRGTGGEPGSKQVRCPTCDGKGSTHVQQRTPFGVISMTTTCNRCGGRGKTYEKICKHCNGAGRVIVKERFRINAERSGGKEHKEGKPRGGIFGIF